MLNIKAIKYGRIKRQAIEKQQTPVQKQPEPKFELTENEKIANKVWAARNH